MKVRCLDCKAHWDLDTDPPACVCEDGGRWQIYDKENDDWGPKEGARRR